MKRSNITRLLAYSAFAALLGADLAFADDAPKTTTANNKTVWLQGDTYQSSQTWGSHYPGVDLTESWKLSSGTTSLGLGLGSQSLHLFEGNIVSALGTTNTNLSAGWIKDTATMDEYQGHHSDPTIKSSNDALLGVYSYNLDNRYINKASPYSGQAPFLKADFDYRGALAFGPSMFCLRPYVGALLTGETTFTATSTTKKTSVSPDFGAGAGLMCSVNGIVGTLGVYREHVADDKTLESDADTKARLYVQKIESNGQIRHTLDLSFGRDDQGLARLSGTLKMMPLPSSNLYVEVGGGAGISDLASSADKGTTGLSYTDQHSNGSIRVGTGF